MLIQLTQPLIKAAVFADICLKQPPLLCFDQTEIQPALRCIQMISSI